MTGYASLTALVSSKRTTWQRFAIWCWWTRRSLPRGIYYCGIWFAFWWSLRRVGRWLIMGGLSFVVIVLCCHHCGWCHYFRFDGMCWCCCSVFIWRDGFLWRWGMFRILLQCYFRCYTACSRPSSLLFSLFSTKLKTLDALCAPNNFLYPASSLNDSSRFWCLDPLKG